MASTGPAAQAAIDEAAALATVVSVPVVTFDERRTTVTADMAMMEANMRAQARRRIVDKIAAAVMLQNWLDCAKSGRDDPPTCRHPRGQRLATRSVGRPRRHRRAGHRAPRRRSHRSLKYLVYFAGDRGDRRVARRRLASGCGTCARSIRPAMPVRSRSSPCCRPTSIETVHSAFKNAASSPTPACSATTSTTTAGSS